MCEASIDKSWFGNGIQHFAVALWEFFLIFLWPTPIKHFNVYHTNSMWQMFWALNTLKRFVLGAEEPIIHPLLKYNDNLRINCPVLSRSTKVRLILIAFPFTFSEVNLLWSGPALTPRSSWRTWKGQTSVWTVSKKCWKRQASGTATWTDPVWTPLTPTAPSLRPTRTQLRSWCTFCSTRLCSCAVVICHVWKLLFSCISPLMWPGSWPAVATVCPGSTCTGKRSWSLEGPPRTAMDPCSGNIAARTHTHNLINTAVITSGLLSGKSQLFFFPVFYAPWSSTCKCAVNLAAISRFQWNLRAPAVPAQLWLLCLDIN